MRNTREAASGGYTCLNVYPGDTLMRVSKWGNSLAIRLPAVVVDALELKEGDSVEIQVASARSFGVSKSPDASALLARLRKFRGRLPADFHFDRITENDRR